MPTPKKVRLADSFGRSHEKSPSMQRPALSFATVQWPLDDSMDMVKVLTERRFNANVHAAVQAIIQEDSFLPVRMWLVPEDGTLDDPDAVTAYCPTTSGILEVGFIAKRAARLYRRQLELIGLKGEAVEVLCYIEGSQHNLYPLLQIYLPADFDQFYEAGYHKDPANLPAWLSDTSPVQKRPLVKKDLSDFTYDEIRKVCCCVLKRNHRKSLPNAIERMLANWDGSEGSMANVAMRAFGVEAYEK